jgi:Ca2+-transporting ATPase
VVIAVDPGDPDVMHRPPRDPAVPITNRNAVIRWIGYAFVLFLAAFAPLVAGPDEPSTAQGTVSLTMTFVVMGLGTAFNAVVNRRAPASGLTPPIGKALAIGGIPVVLLFLATELPIFQDGLLTVALSPRQWLTCFGLAALLPIVVELDKLVTRRGLRTPATLSPDHAVAPARARHTPVPAEVGSRE